MQTQNVGPVIRTFSNLINRKVNEMIVEEEDSLTPQQGWVLCYLVKNLGREVFQKDLEEQFTIRRSTANHMMQLMERNGYIERISVPEDARMRRIMLTPKGTDAHVRIKDRLNRFEALLQKDFSEEEILLFLGMIERMEKNIR